MFSFAHSLPLILRARSKHGLFNAFMARVVNAVVIQQTTIECHMHRPPVHSHLPSDRLTIRSGHSDNCKVESGVTILLRRRRVAN